MAYRYPLIANPETKRLEEIKETDLLTLYRTGIVSATSIESEYFYGNLVGIATTALNLYDAANITLGVIDPERLSGNYDINVTTATNLENAANILSGTIENERLSGSYDIDISGTATNANNLTDGSNILAGTVPRARLTGTYDINITGAAFTSTYAEFSNRAIYSDFAVGTAIEVFENNENKVLYPAVLSGAGITFAEVSPDNFTFNPALGNLGIGTTLPINSLQVNIYGVETGIGTFLAQSGVYSEIDSFDLTESNYKTAEYTLHFQSGSTIQSQKVLVMQNGTNAYSEQYAIMSQPSLLVSVGSTISSNDCILRVLPESGVTGIVTYRFSRNTLL